MGSGLAGIAAAAAMVGIGYEPPPPPTRVGRRTASRHYIPVGTNTTHHYQHGERERTRRMKQIARGSLRHENGLDASVPEFGLTMNEIRQKAKEAHAAATEAWHQGGEIVR